MPEIKRRTPTGAAVHMNCHLPVVIGYRTLFSLDTCSLDENHLTELCIVAYDMDFRINPKYPFFDVQFCPPLDQIDDAGDRRCNYSQSDLARLYKLGIRSNDANTLFEGWWNGLELDHNKRIAPCTYDWASLQYLLMNWLGPWTFDHFFQKAYVSDLLAVSRFMNDLAAHRGEPYPFNGHAMSRIFYERKIPERKVYSATDMARNVLAAYRSIVYQPNPNLFFGTEAVNGITGIDPRPRSGTVGGGETHSSPVQERDTGTEMLEPERGCDTGGDTLPDHCG